ncbi:MAG: YCF48-related protein [Chitinophagaceae bacterium]|nr:YCF48-related protein [Chitinophagaceae bacterium]
MRKLTIILLLAFLGNTSIYSCKKPKKSQPPQPPGWKEVNLNYNSPLTKVKILGNDTFYILSYLDIVNDFTKTVIFYSYDKGNTWQSARFPRPSEGGLRNIFPVTKIKMYGATSGFYKSENSLTNWKMLDSLQGAGLGGTVNDGFFFNEQSGIIIKPVTVLKTTDGGISFQPKFTSPIAGYFRKITFPSNTIGYIAAGETHDNINVGFLSKTTNAGETWNVIKSDVGDITSVFFANIDSGYIFNSKRQMYKTNDGGISWQLVSSNCPVSPDLVYFLDINYGYMASGELLYKTKDGGLNWHKEFETGGGNIGDIGFTKDGVGVVVTNNGKLMVRK